MRNSHVLNCVVTLFILSLLAVAVQAAPMSIAITNGNFEADGTINDLPGSTPASPITGWYNTAPVGDGYDLANGATGGKGGSVGARSRRDVNKVWQPLAHAWQPTDMFELTFWAQDWFNKDPLVLVNLYESDADNGNLGDNPLLWTGTTGPAADAGTDFLFNIDASTFTVGTPGSSIVLQFGSVAGSDDYNVLDDVALTVDSPVVAVPEPQSLAIWLLIGSCLTGFGYFRPSGRRKGAILG